MDNQQQNPSNCCCDREGGGISDKAEDRLKKIIQRYPQTKSAIMPALYLAQEELGWLSDEALSWVSSRLGLPKSHVLEVATFYTMYYKRPVGKYHLQVCRTLSCMLGGAPTVVDYLRHRCGLEGRDLSEDGFWSIEEVECLGSCGTAPVVQINDVFFERMTPEKLEDIIGRIEREKPNLRYSVIRESVGKGMPDRPRSEVW